MNPVCGVEISMEGLSYAVLEHYARGPRILGHGRVPLGGDSDPVQILRELRESGRIPTRRLRVALGTQASQLRTHDFPRMPRRDVELVIQGKIERELELRPEPTAAGFVVRRIHGGRWRALVALTSRQDLVELQERIAQNGFVLEALTTSSAALISYLLADREAARSAKPAGILHLGAGRAVLAIVYAGHLRFLQDLELGVDAALLGGRATGTHGADVDWNHLDMGAEDLSELSQVAGQVRRTLADEAQQRPDYPVTRLFLAGDRSRTEAMVGLLRNELSVPVDLLDTATGLRTGGTPSIKLWRRAVAAEAIQENPDDASGAALVIPVALARIVDADSLLHLGSPARQLSLPRAPIIGAGLIVGAAILGVLAAVVGSRIGEVERQSDSLEQHRLSLIQAHGEDLAAARGVPSPEIRALRNAPLPEEILIWIAAILPASGVIDHLQIKRSEGGWLLLVEGEVRPGSVTAAEAWSQLTESLARSPDVSELHIHELTANPTGAIPFSIDLVRKDLSR